MVILTCAVRCLCRDEQKPNNDLPNQEKNQYCSVYWYETWALYMYKEDDRTSRIEAMEIGSDVKIGGNENQ